MLPFGSINSLPFKQVSTISAPVRLPKPLPLFSLLEFAPDWDANSSRQGAGRAVGAGTRPAPMSCGGSCRPHPPLKPLPLFSLLEFAPDWDANSSRQGAGRVVGAGTRPAPMSCGGSCRPHPPLPPPVPLKGEAPPALPTAQGRGQGHWAFKRTFVSSSSIGSPSLAPTLCLVLSAVPHPNLKAVEPFLSAGALMRGNTFPPPLFVTLFLSILRKSIEVVWFRGVRLKLNVASWFVCCWGLPHSIPRRIAPVFAPLSVWI